MFREKLVLACLPGPLKSWERELDQKKFCTVVPSTIEAFCAAALENYVGHWEDERVPPKWTKGEQRGTFSILKSKNRETQRRQLTKMTLVLFSFDQNLWAGIRKGSTGTRNFRMKSITSEKDQEGWRKSR
jgi:hypothetical protein